METACKVTTLGCAPHVTWKVKGNNGSSFIEKALIKKIGGGTSEEKS